MFGLQGLFHAKNSVDIRYFLINYAKWTQPKVSSALDKETPCRSVVVLAQDDLIRREHDRGKIKKRKKRKT